MHIFPFMESATTDMSKFYQQIFTAMVEIHNTKASPKAVQKFVHLAQDRYVGVQLGIIVMVVMM